MRTTVLLSYSPLFLASKIRTIFSHFYLAERIKQLNLTPFAQQCQPLKSNHLFIFPYLICFFDYFSSFFIAKIFPIQKDTF